VYVDGGETVRAALDAGRVDELVVTVISVVLGRGRPLFHGLPRRHGLEIVYHRDYGTRGVQYMFHPSR
jgi:dihydrofolate reductase